MTKQTAFEGFEKPRKPRVKRMAVFDAGHMPGGGKGIQFVCKRCGHDTGWIADEWTVTENRKGLPCPECNKPNTSSAVMQQRHVSKDEADDFPTPPWATRALCEKLKALGIDLAHLKALEPCCNRGYMARPLAEYFAKVIATDLHDYGWDGQDQIADFLDPQFNMAVDVDWVIGNPPFKLGMEFILRALDVAKHGVAMFVRTSFVEGIERDERLYSKHPERWFMPFAERVILYKGVLLDPDVKIRKWNKKKNKWVAEKPSSATSYCWLVWVKGHDGLPQMVRISRCRKQLTKPGDYPELPDELKPEFKGLGIKQDDQLTT